MTSPGNRTQLVMDTGVVWEQLATNTAHHLDFMEILYPPGSSSTNDKRMLRHEGFEYGYLIEGELEVTFGFETFTLARGRVARPELLGAAPVPQPRHGPGPRHLVRAPRARLSCLSAG